MPLPAEIFDGLRKGNQVARTLIRQQAEELSMSQPTLDRAGTLGGAGHFSVDVRASTGQRRLAAVHDAPIDNTPDDRGALPTERASGAVIAVNAGVGLAPGFPVGGTRVFGIDLLGGVALASNPSVGAVEVDGEKTPVSGHFGIRIGVLEETAKLPGLGLSVGVAKGTERSFAWSESVSGSGGTSPITVSGVQDTELSGWRLTAGKHFGRLGVAAGMGRDSYEGIAAFGATYANRSDDTYFNTEGTIWNWYGSVSYRAGPVALVGELRYQQDKETGIPAGDAMGIGRTRRTMMTFGVAYTR